MSIPIDSFIILDIGTAWTKAFLVDPKETLKVKVSAKLPTSTEDLRYSANLLINKLKQNSKNPKILITSAFSEANSLEKELDASFVTKEQVNKELFEWFTLQSLENPIILDGGANNFLRNLRAADIGAYLSFPIGEKDLENYIGNKTMRLSSIPEDKNHLEIEEAVLRASFNLYPDFHNPTKFNSVVITGGILSWSTKPTRLALLLLDLMSGGKVVQVFQDKSAFLNSFGALIYHKKVFKQKNDILRNLGSIVSLGGGGKVALDYGLSDIQEVTISENEIALIPALSSQSVKITLFSEPKRVFQVSGGEWGVILDGRVKPLPLQFGQVRTRQAVTSWQRALEKVEVLDI